MVSTDMATAPTFEEVVELVAIPTTLDCEQCGEETDPRDMVGVVCWECAE